MSCLIVGTVPYDDFPLTEAPCVLNENRLHVGNETVRITRGTPALLAAASLAAKVLGVQAPKALLAGDTGHGRGSASVYKHLADRLDEGSESLMVFHYLLPDLDWHSKIVWKIEELRKKPTLVADAGFMYVAKMSGYAPYYDLFTPDVGELAFLADESAPHPFYTRGFLLQNEERVPELIERAYTNEDAARFLLVKGRCDYIASQEGIIATVAEPSIEAMEPIGGTGDSLTGIVATLLAAGKSVPDAAILAARVNRLLGLLTNPTPASSVADLLPALPRAMDQALRS